MRSRLLSTLVLALATASCVQPARLVRSDAERVLATTTIDAPNPAEPGSYQVGTFTYGSGTDKRRAAFRDSVTVRTRSVNGTPSSAASKASLPRSAGSTGASIRRRCR